MPRTQSCASSFGTCRRTCKARTQARERAVVSNSHSRAVLDREPTDADVRELELLPRAQLVQRLRDMHAQTVQLAREETKELERGKALAVLSPQKATK